MEFFGEVKIDWLGKKWYFLAFSLIFSVAGLLSLFFWHGLPLDVDFRGGTVVRVKFTDAPDINRLRDAAQTAGLKDAPVITYGPAANHEIIITLPEARGGATSALGHGPRRDCFHADGELLRNRQTESGDREARPGQRGSRAACRLAGAEGSRTSGPGR